jgi:hypothetical protein
LWQKGNVVGLLLLFAWVSIETGEHVFASIPVILIHRFPESGGCRSLLPLPTMTTCSIKFY